MALITLGCTQKQSEAGRNQVPSAHLKRIHGVFVMLLGYLHNSQRIHDRISPEILDFNSEGSNVVEQRPQALWVSCEAFLSEILMLNNLSDSFLECHHVLTSRILTRSPSLLVM